MNTINEILLRRKHKINLPAKEFSSSTDKTMVMTLIKNIESYGFTFDKELIQNLMTYSSDEIAHFYFDLINKLKPLVGADKEYTPMYPNFPRQVADASDAELFFNALTHYWTYGTWQPNYPKNDRLPLLDMTNMTVLTCGSNGDIVEIYKNLLSSKTSLSAQDKADIETIVDDLCNLSYYYLPDEIPLKENAAFIAKTLLDKSPVFRINAIQKYFKTATDVLRLVVALSDGDISLAKNTKFRSLRRKERRMIMDLLAGCSNILEDMYRYQYQWIRIGEILHPMEKCYNIKKYENVRNAFDILRNEKKPLFLPGRAQEAIKSGDMHKAVNLLKDRPGDFARQLDKLLRDYDDMNYVVDVFRSIADKISIPVLLQLREHFINRNLNDIRVAFPKGNVAKAMSIPTHVKYIPHHIRANIVNICEAAIKENFSTKNPMGKVYIDNALRTFVVPFSQRSASSGNKMLVRGSRVPLEKETSIARAFIWWTNQKNGRVDLDLSAAIYDAEWNHCEHISYTNLRSSKYKAYHSGDITNGGGVNGKGVAEFIDIDIDSVRKNHGRYVVFQVYSFTQQKFSDLQNCRFGWMERQGMNSGEIFEPSTVDMSIDINTDSTILIPVIFDCVTKEFIWCDMIAEMPRWCAANNLENNLSGVTAACYAITHFNKPNIYDLIRFNVSARGIQVYNRNEADIIFSNDTTPPVEQTLDGWRVKSEVPIITAYDLDYFMSQML